MTLFLGLIAGAVLGAVGFYLVLVYTFAKGRS